jgi:hypothetical protein
VGLDILTPDPYERKKLVYFTVGLYIHRHTHNTARRSVFGKRIFFFPSVFVFVPEEEESKTKASL